MAQSAATPIIVGVGDIVNRSRQLEDAVEPLGLMIEAIQTAIKDSGAPENAVSEFKSSIDSISVVATWTWSYKDLPSILEQRLGTQAQHRAISGHGGNSPGLMLDEAARRISRGDSKVAVVVGAESLASLEAFGRARKAPNWTEPDPNVPNIASVKNVKLEPSLGATHSIGLPTQVYPLYENGFRAHRGQSIAENNSESAKLYAEFSNVAVKNPYAWQHGKQAETAESIGTPSKKNRIISFPYTLLMNAFNNVNMSAACILTNTEFARHLGIPELKWVYPLGGAGTSDSNNFWERPNFYSAPSISRSLDAAFQVSGLQKEEIDFYDFYSCFPIVPKLASAHLGLPIVGSPKPITLLGGLTSFGGAGNNYSSHAITAMVRQLRTQTGRRINGLVLANGGILTYQHVVLLSNQPRKDGSSYPKENPLPPVLTDEPTTAVDDVAEGEAMIETYTVDYNREGKPHRGYVVGRLKRNGHRFVANHADEATLLQLASGSEEPIGRRGFVKYAKDQGGKNLFSFERVEKL